MSDHDVLALYVLDSLPDHERIAFDTHLATCEQCQRELSSYGPTLAHLADAVEVQPPGELREQVLARIRHVQQEPTGSTGGRGSGDVAPVVTLPVRQPPTATDGRWAAIAAVILAFALIAAGTTGIVLWRQNTVLEQRLAALAQADRLAAVLAAPDAELIDVETDLRGDLRVAVAPSLDEGVVVADDLEPPPDGRVYQLWLIDDGEPRSAGLVARTSGVLGVLAPIDRAQAVAVSIEPPSGSATPTGPIVGQAALQ